MKNATELLAQLLKQANQAECHGMLLVVVRGDHFVELAAAGMNCDRVNALHVAIDQAVRVVQKCDPVEVTEEEVDLDEVEAGGGTGGGSGTVH